MYERCVVNEMLTIEGKTKQIKILVPGTDIAVVTSNEYVTAGDGSKRDLLKGKSELATRTACNIFELLAKNHMPIAYIGRDGKDTFITHFCSMIPIEVVVRSVAAGSYIQRWPEIKEGQMLNPYVVEFFYKTTNRRIDDDVVLPCDNPLLVISSRTGDCQLYHPSTGAYLFDLAKTEIEGFELASLLSEFERIADQVFTVLENAWANLGGTLYDFRLKLGFKADKSIVVAGVIDCDSWRVLWNGIQLYKQGYREEDDLEKVLAVYRLVAALTDRMS